MGQPSCWQVLMRGRTNQFLIYRFSSERKPGTPGRTPSSAAGPGRNRNKYRSQAWCQNIALSLAWQKYKTAAGKVK